MKRSNLGPLLTLLVLLSVPILFWMGSCSKSGIQTHANVLSPPAGTKILYQVPLVSQSTDYSCGAAALLSVLKYYGMEDYTERDLMKFLKTDPKTGTEIENILEFANQKKLGAVLRSNLTLKEIEESIAKDHPVLVEIQAWPDDEGARKFYKNHWDDGHFVVVIGIDSLNLYFADPSLFSHRGIIPRDAFLDRWHDLSPSGEKRYHTGVVFNGTPRAGWQMIQ